MLFIVLEWSLYEAMTIMSGLISLEDQFCQVIYYNLISLIASAPLGIQSATCSLVGRQIGEGDISKAWRYYKCFVRFSFFVYVVEYGIVVAFHNSIFRIFTDDLNIISISKDVFVYVIVACSLDFWQIIFGGTIRALGL